MTSNGLHAASFARTAAIVRDRRNVDDRGNFETDRLESTDSGVTAKTRTGNADDDVLEAVRHRIAGGVLSDNLGGVGGGLAGAAEIALTGAGPSKHVALEVSDSDDGVVEGRSDVSNA